jgi:tetratricopeptide (TPR) repeat protein
MTRTRSSIFSIPLILAICLLASTALWAVGQGRLRGTVVDEDGEPVEGVVVTVTCKELPSFREVKTTDKRGTFMVTFNQPHLAYTYLVEKPGYQSFEQEIAGTATRMIRQTFLLERATVEGAEEASKVPLLGGSDEAIAAYNEGVAALQAGDLGTARTRLEAAILADSELAEAHGALAGVYLNQRDFEKAVSAAEKALALRPGDRRALEVQYEAYRALGRNEEAQAASEALKAAEDNAATARRIYNEAGEAYEAGDLETALGKFRDAAALDPTLHDARHAVASLLLKKGDFAGAAEAADAARALKPDDTRTLEVAYQAYNGLGESGKAAEILVRLSELDSRYGATSLLEQGAQLFNTGRGDEAKALFESALAVDAGLAKAHYMLGLYYINQGSSDIAKDHLSQFLEMSPEDPDAATARDMLQYLE